MITQKGEIKVHYVLFYMKHYNDIMLFEEFGVRFLGEGECLTPGAIYYYEKMC